MSDTPETDAFLRDLNDYSDVELRAMTEHARKLERERDEARGEQCSIQCAFEDSQDKIEKLERERDEAQESLKHIAEYGTEEINAAVDLRQKLASALLERDEAREALMKIEDLFIDGTDIYADREKMGIIARAALEGAK